MSLQGGVIFRMQVNTFVVGQLLGVKIAISSRFSCIADTSRAMNPARCLRSLWRRPYSSQFHWIRAIFQLFSRVNHAKLTFFTEELSRRVTQEIICPLVSRCSCRRRCVTDNLSVRNLKGARQIGKRAITTHISSPKRGVQRDVAEPGAQRKRSFPPHASPLP
jgi:hypothetical protein